MIDVGAGAYLAGRHALFASDYESSASYFARALMNDPDNGALMESLVLSQLALGNVAAAVPVARKMEAAGLRSQGTRITLAVDHIMKEDYQPLVDAVADRSGIGPLIDGLLAGWANMGLGSVSKALERFDEVADEKGLRSFALYHKALALALVGDFEGAEAIYSDEHAGLLGLSRRAVIARAQILSQLGRDAEALEMMTDAFGTSFDPGLTALADRLAAGETVPFDHITSVRDGMAEVFFAVASALRGEASDDFALIYARVASDLRPDHIDALLLSADLLDQLGQYDLAVATYKQVPADSPDYHAAELGRADALRSAGKTDAAIEVLERLAKDYPGLPVVHTSLGDLLRQQEDYAGAVAAYDKALEYTEEGAPGEWFLLYARGIAHERLKQWDAAETDLRHALQLNPDQPQVLNYLGYSLVERKVKLDEALGMIERAVAAQPDSGYIVDSLGWVLFRLGRYQEAVGHMEHAVELMAVDPVVNDHLGDVYWAVGRKREAEFQWKRALSFIKPDETDGEADPDRIRRKLDVGLDQVLAEEGAPPLSAADGE
ncbi:tetratricopeptide repeat protein [Pseudodonghicola sp. IC7]|uniref:Tetratricopeptide repeat protein n=2 Tax=Pseudodonghicola flavimaris TaxID=3050036 RepID=A0ABT7EX98_9RHOB|nr:tetratricopeptide repeat protein [Pseudodonghicola flavimaris]MDK3016972.1 tetratricopeptide repeat protein [Pseudodonghicola flavimaris]